jgi:PIN domain nuclease of toxin-antitoxin system
LIGNLVDTGAVLLVLAAPERLSSTIRDAVERGPNWLSTLSYWEVVIKTMKGKLDVGDPHTWWDEALHQLSATALPLYPRHVSAIVSLPRLHGDPFDRALIAQAMVEKFALVTTDAEILRYASDHLQIVQ